MPRIHGEGRTKHQSEGGSEMMKTMTFRKAMWLAPLAYAIHIAEEAPGFATWASAHFADGFTTAQFVKNNLVVMGILLGWVIAHFLLQRKWTAFFVLLQTSSGMFHNAIFHIGMTLYLGVYSPGVVTSVLLYLPISLLLAWLTFREKIISIPLLVVAVILGAVSHAAFVYSQLFTETLRL